MATSVAASIRRAFGGIRGRRTAAAPDSTPARISSSQRWVYGLGIGAAWEADVWGRIRSKKAAAQGRKRRAGSRLRICPAVARRCRGARVFLDHRSRAAGSERTGNARSLPGVFEAHRRAQRAGLRERLRRGADQVAHRQRAGRALRRAGGAGAGDPRHRGRHQPLPRRQA